MKPTIQLFGGPLDGHTIPWLPLKQYHIWTGLNPTDKSVYLENVDKLPRALYLRRRRDRFEFKQFVCIEEQAKPG